MIETFTLKQQKAIEEKTKQLREILDGTLNPKELAQSITQRRLEWLAKNRILLRTDLPLLESTLRLLIYNHMGVEEGISTEMISANLLRIESRNFCPYLEACQWLGMDTRFVCKEIGEPSIIAFFHEINPHLDFYRNYDKIRPYSDYCEEFLEASK